MHISENLFVLFLPPRLRVTSIFKGSQFGNRVLGAEHRRSGATFVSLETEREQKRELAPESDEREIPLDEKFQQIKVAAPLFLVTPPEIFVVPLVQFLIFLPPFAKSLFSF